MVYVLRLFMAFLLLSTNMVETQNILTRQRSAIFRPRPSIINARVQRQSQIRTQSMSDREPTRPGLGDSFLLSRLQNGDTRAFNHLSQLRQTVDTPFTVMQELLSIFSRPQQTSASGFAGILHNMAVARGIVPNSHAFDISGQPIQTTTISATDGPTIVPPPGRVSRMETSTSSQIFSSGLSEFQTQTSETTSTPSFIPTPAFPSNVVWINQLSQSQQTRIVSTTPRPLIRMLLGNTSFETSIPTHNGTFNKRNSKTFDITPSIQQSTTTESLDILHLIRHGDLFANSRFDLPLQQSVVDKPNLDLNLIQSELTKPLSEIISEFDNVFKTNISINGEDLGSSLTMSELLHPFASDNQISPFNDTLSTSANTFKLDVELPIDLRMENKNALIIQANDSDRLDFFTSQNNNTLTSDQGTTNAIVFQEVGPIRMRPENVTLQFVGDLNRTVTHTNISIHYVGELHLGKGRNFQQNIMRPGAEEFETVLMHRVSDMQRVPGERIIVHGNGSIRLVSKERVILEPIGFVRFQEVNQSTKPENDNTIDVPILRVEPLPPSLMETIYSRGVQPLDGSSANDTVLIQVMAELFGVG